MLHTGVLLVQVGGRSGYHCVVVGMLVSIQKRPQRIAVHVRSMVQGEPFWRVLLAETRHLETFRLMICELCGNS